MKYYLNNHCNIDCVIEELKGFPNIVQAIPLTARFFRHPLIECAFHIALIQNVHNGSENPRAADVSGRDTDPSFIVEDVPSKYLL